MSEQVKENRIHPAVLNGGALILIGVLLLLNQLDIINFSFWALVLFAVGLLKILQSADQSGRVWGLLFIAGGAALELNERGYARFRFEHIWPLFIIVAGLIMIWRAYRQHDPAQGEDNPFPSQLNVLAVLGGGEYRILSKNFRGGDLIAFMGGFDVDLREADIEGDQATINVSAIMGGGVLRVPENWTVSMRVSSFVGGHSIKTRESGPVQKTLIVKGLAFLGGVEVRN